MNKDDEITPEQRDDQIGTNCRKINETHILWKYGDPRGRLDSAYKLRVYAQALVHLLEPRKS